MCMLHIQPSCQDIMFAVNVSTDSIYVQCWHVCQTFHNWKVEGMVMLLLQPTRLPNGRRQFKAHHWIFFKDSRRLFICFCSDKTRWMYFDPFFFPAVIMPTKTSYFSQEVRPSPFVIAMTKPGILCQQWLFPNHKQVVFVYSALWLEQNLKFYLNKHEVAT